MGMLKIVPRLARMALGFQMSETGSAAITASTPAPSAERSSAPRFPGFSTCSMTAMSGRSGSRAATEARSVGGVSKTATMPSSRSP